MSPLPAKSVTLSGPKPAVHPARAAPHPSPSRGPPAQAAAQSNAATVATAHKPPPAHGPGTSNAAVAASHAPGPALRMDAAAASAPGGALDQMAALPAYAIARTTPTAMHVVKLAREPISNSKVALTTKAGEQIPPEPVPRTKPLTTKERQAATDASKKGLDKTREETRPQAKAASKPAKSTPRAVKPREARPKVKPPHRDKKQPNILGQASVKHPAIKKAAHPAPSGKKLAAPKTIKRVFQVPRLALPRAASAGAQRVLDKFALFATGARQRFADKIAKGTTSIGVRAEQARSTVLAAGARQTGRLRSSFQSSRTHVERSTSAAQSQAHAAGARSQANLSQAHVTNVANANSEFAAKQQRARTLGHSYSEQAAQTANDVAGKMDSTVRQRAQQARDIGKSMAQRGSPPEVAEAKRKVALEISEDTASKVSDGVDDGAEQIRGTAPQASQAFQNNGEDIATHLDSGKSGLVEQLDGLSAQASSSIQQTASSSTQQLGQTKSAIVSQLSTTEQDGVAHLTQEIAHKADDAQHAAGDAVDALHTQADKTLAAGDARIDEIAKCVVPANIPTTKADELSQSLGDQLTKGFDGVGAQLDNAANRVGNSLVSSGGEVATAADTAVGALGQQVQGSIGHADAQINQQRQQLSSQLSEIASGVGKTGGDAVTHVSTALNDNLDQADAGFKQSLADYRTHLTNQVTGADSKANEPVNTLTNRIDEAQQRAAERAQRSWISNQLHDLGEMLSDPGFWAGLVVGLLLALVVIALIVAGTLTGGLAIVLAMALVGAIAGAVGSVVGQATNHSFTGGWDWSRVSVKQVLISAGLGAVSAAAITALVLWMGPTVATSLGGIAIISLATGAITIISNLITGQPWDKNLLGNMLFAGLLGWLAKYIPQPRWFGGPRPPPEVETPPGIKSDPEPTLEEPETEYTVPGKASLVRDVAASETRLTELQQKINGLNQGDRAGLQARTQAAADELARIRQEAEAAASERQVNKLRERLNGVNDELNNVAKDPLVTLGLRQRAIDAIRTMENIKMDPVGDVNQVGNKNHYGAARREAVGEVVARRPDGRPFDHIQDLQQAYNGLERVRAALEAEQNNPPTSMTDRGLDVLVAKYSEVQAIISRLRGFLMSIGQGPPYPPFHQWPPGS